jgi:hypothetical protein
VWDQATDVPIGELFRGCDPVAKTESQRPAGCHPKAGRTWISRHGVRASHKRGRRTAPRPSSPRRWPPRQRHCAAMRSCGMPRSPSIDGCGPTRAGWRSSWRTASRKRLRRRWPRSAWWNRSACGSHPAVRGRGRRGRRGGGSPGVGSAVGDRESDHQVDDAGGEHVCAAGSSPARAVTRVRVRPTTLRPVRWTWPSR